MLFQYTLPALLHRPKNTYIKWLQYVCSIRRQAEKMNSQFTFFFMRFTLVGVVAIKNKDNRACFKKKFYCRVELKFKPLQIVGLLHPPRRTDPIASSCRTSLSRCCKDFCLDTRQKGEASCLLHFHKHSLAVMNWWSHPLLTSWTACEPLWQGFFASGSKTKSSLISMHRKISHHSTTFDKAYFLEEGLALGEPSLKVSGFAAPALFEERCCGFLSLRDGHRPRKYSHQSFPGRAFLKGHVLLCSCKKVETTSVTNSLVSP